MFVIFKRQNRLIIALNIVIIQGTRLKIRFPNIIIICDDTAPCFGFRELFENFVFIHRIAFREF